MKIFITKYALTQGILEREADQPLADSPGFVSIRHNEGLCISENYHGEGKEWHRSIEAAKRHAEAMRQAKIKSLKAQIAKLEKLAF